MRAYEDLPDSFFIFDDIYRRKPKPKPKKESTMNRKEVIEANLRRLEAEIAEIESYPTEPVNGKVIKFQKQFTEEGPVYNYAAIRAVGLWNTTGPKAPKAYTWEELMSWMGKDARTTLRIVGNWKGMV